MLSYQLLAALSGGANAYFSLSDPSDQIDPAPWAVDNAQATNYSFMPVIYSHDVSHTENQVLKPH